MTIPHWYYAHLRWAVMVEGKGLRHWVEAVYVFRGECRQAAFRQAPEIGHRREGRYREGRRFVTHQLAAVVTLDTLGTNPEQFRVDLGVKKPKAHLPFEHVFDPEGTEPACFF